MKLTVNRIRSTGIGKGKKKKSNLITPRNPFAKDEVIIMKKKNFQIF